MTHALVLTAAGGSSRMGDAGKKEYLTISETPEGRISVLSSALFAFLETRLFSIVLITIPAGDEAKARSILSEDRRIKPLLDETGCRLSFTEGGASRQDSVRRGLESIAIGASADKRTPATVMIHDAARPWISSDLVRSVLSTVLSHGAAVPAIPAVDTQKETDDTGRIIRHLDRSRVMAVQTPQGFRFTELLDAHRKAANDGHLYTDDTEIWGRYSGDVYICPGDRANRKVTFKEDLS